MKHKIDIKPLSVNRAYQGRRFSTQDHKAFVAKVWYHLKRLKPTKPLKGEKAAHYQWGFSSKSSDTDNPTKVFQDILADFWGMKDDKDIGFIILERKMVRKGKEFIGFDVFSRRKLIAYLEDLVERLKQEEGA